MEDITIRDGIDKMDFEKITRMLSNAYWSPRALAAGHIKDEQKQ